jgi:hypothetical protein
VLGSEALKHPAFGGGVFEIAWRHSSRLTGATAGAARDVEAVTTPVVVSGEPLEQPAARAKRRVVPLGARKVRSRSVQKGAILGGSAGVQLILG